MRHFLPASSYFSIFFAPIILPIIVWIVSRDHYVEMHSKYALISHILPLIAAVPLIILSFKANQTSSVFGYIMLFAIIYLGTVIYNIVKGIKVLLQYA
ncbi:DUF4870 domain-containing protein [Paenibacillus sp. KQZ6P-2]|uniref:DUF4870 domain-containing protein n=1 Tax=Paenibacillus mangrovi TaxID=2931978 RepID=A0A9X2B6I5_9BACL|nr:DUF4870 domain-containing protein [Paenibacillus mangrovi]MCJ8013847.1 DUF4870 domain-containing protein [Paenibacillus mangrovi]